MREINDQNYLQELFIKEAKPALEWFSIRFGKKKGLIDMNTVDAESNRFINRNNGNLTDVSATGGDWAHTDYIEVTPGTIYFFEAIHANAATAGIAWYDANKKFISGISSTNVGNAEGILVAPDDAAYIRVCFRIDEGYNTNWRNTVQLWLASDVNIE